MITLCGKWLVATIPSEVIELNSRSAGSVNTTNTDNVFIGALVSALEDGDSPRCAQFRERNWCGCNDIVRSLCNYSDIRRN